MMANYEIWIHYYNATFDWQIYNKKLKENLGYIFVNFDSILQNVRCQLQKNFMEMLANVSDYTFNVRFFLKPRSLFSGSLKV